MPGAPILVDQLEDLAVLEDDVVARHLRARITQPVSGTLFGAHASVVQNQMIDDTARRTMPRIGRGPGVTDIVRCHCGGCSFFHESVGKS